MAKCEKCEQYEKDEDNELRGWCAREHRWVDWNDTPEFTGCEYDN